MKIILEMKKEKYSDQFIKGKNIAIKYDKNLIPMNIKENLKDIKICKNNDNNNYDNHIYEFSDNDNKDEMLSSFTPSEKTKSK